MIQITFDEALIKVGASNWYQKRAFIIFCMQWFIGNWILISPIYLNQNPLIDCQGNQTCSEVCQNLKQMSKDMNSECKQFICDNRQYIQGESLSNAFGKVIQCGEEYLTTVFQGMTYLGSLIGFFIFPYIADNYGRKPALQMSWGLATIGLLLQALNTNFQKIQFSINYYMTTIGLFTTGFGLNPAITLHFSLFNEHTIGHFRVIQNTGVQICYGLGEMVLVLIAYYFQNWRELVIWMTVPVLLLNFANIFILESPKFLYSKSKSKAVYVLNQIAKVNGKELIDIDSIQENELGKFNKQKTYSIIDLFKYNSLRWIFMGWFQIFFSIQFFYYGIGFATDSLGLNLYINNLIISSFEVAAYCISDYFIVKIKRRLWTSIVFIMVGIISVAYYVIPNNQTWQVIQILLLGFMRFSICFVWALSFTYVSELFPTVVRSTALGLISLGGTLGSVISPIIKNLIASPQLIMVVFGAFAILGGLVVIPMRETLNKPLQDEITEEIRRKSMVADAYVNPLISESDFTQSQNQKIS